MALTITTKPAYPVPGRVRVTFVPSSTVNYVRIWSTVAPEGSEYRERLDASSTVASAARALVYEHYTKEIWQPFLTVGGRYTFKIQEYTRDTDEGAFELDPRGAPQETKVGAEQTLTLYIGELITQKITTRDLDDSIEFVFYVFDDTIRETSLQVHGVKSPGYRRSTSERLRLASQNTSVVAKMDLLTGSTVTSAIGNLAPLIQELRTELNTHMLNSGSYHTPADTENAAKVLGTPVNSTLQGAIFLGTLEIQAAFINHVSNVPDQTHETASGVKNSDYDSLPFMKPPRSVADCTAALADLARCAARHYVTTAVHRGNTDATPALTATLGLLGDVHKAFFESIQLTASAPPPAQSGTWKALQHGFGLERRLIRSSTSLDTDELFGPDRGKL